MADMQPRPGTFVVDSTFLKREARAGLRSFFAPFTGLAQVFSTKEEATKAAAPLKVRQARRVTYRARKKQAVKKRA
jgi:hypothetical protein